MMKEKQKKILNFFFILLLLAYLFLVGKRFLDSLASIDFAFGYVDYQSNWKVLEDFLSMKTPFKDYYHSYGLFFMFLQAPAFIAFGKNFLALLISRDLYLPLIGIGISYFVAKIILRKKSLIFIFMFLALLFGTNYDFTSVRHLVAELSLSLFIFSLLKERKSVFLSGLIAGLALLTALEYGIALNLTISLLFILYLFGKAKEYFFRVGGEKRLFFGLFKEFLLGEMIVLFPFLIWLFFSGSLVNYWNFTFGFINNFYHASPFSGDSFPRFEEINSLRLGSPLLIFGLPILFLQKLNLYFNIIFLLINGLVSLIILTVGKNFSKRNFLKMGLVFYGLLISLRTLDTPCIGYFKYSLVPSLLLITLLIEDVDSWVRHKKLILKILGFSLILVIYFWLILTENTGYLVKIFGKKKSIVKESFEKTFYPPVGWWLRNDLIEGYQQITDYVVKNTDKYDYLYVYPWGPYNQLTDRRSPTGANNSSQLRIVGEKLMNLTQRELEQKKPKLVVINLYNNLGIAGFGEERGDVSRYFSVGGEEGPVFAGESDEVRKYILENYQTALKNDLAIVMKPRDIPLELKDKKQEIYSWTPGQPEKTIFQSMRELNPGRYKITGSNASWTLILENPIKATDVYVEIKIDGDLFTKHLSRYFVEIYASDEKEEKVGETRTLATKTWQTDKIYFNQPEMIKTIKIEMGENGGLIWWMHPYNLGIRKISFFE